jgi:hypothetical protein
LLPKLAPNSSAGRGSGHQAAFNFGSGIGSITFSVPLMMYSGYPVEPYSFGDLGC